MSDTRLRPTLGLFSATILATSIVVGAGMLALPGLVYREVGRGAFWCWLADAAMSLPLLWVFVRLGRAHPSAGGVAGFVAVVWPGARTGISLVLLGTFSLGIPAIALTGSRYVLAAFEVASSPGLDSLVAWLLLCSAATLVALGARLAARWQNAVVGALLLLLLAMTLATAPRWPLAANAPMLSWPGLQHGMALAFFSFTGFEMFASIAEDMRNPQRDFKRAVFLSFLAICCLYVGAALAVETTVSRQDPALTHAPFLAVAQQLLGTRPWSASLFGALVVLIVFTNLVGASWAASRMVFDLGRSTAVGQRLRLHVLDQRTSSPRRALAAALGTFALVLLAHAARLLSLSDMLWFAGQNFFVLYVACIGVFFVTAKVRLERVVAVVSLASLLWFGAVFSWGLLYPALLFTLPFLRRYIGRTAVAV